MNSTELSCTKISGRIRSVGGGVVRATLPRACVGDLCWIESRGGSTQALVTSFTDSSFTLSPFGNYDGLYPGALVETFGTPPTILVGPDLVGRAVNALGMPIDDGPPLKGGTPKGLHCSPPAPSSRPLISSRLSTGVKAIDAFCSLGIGQRLGLFASAGVGKSTLLGLVTSHADVDIVIVALVGERGREVREFVEHTLASSEAERSVVVVATSDETSAMRQTAPYTATTIAEYFRDRGMRVLLVIDSLTRFARAIRETGLAAGEIPVRQGYTSSVYTMLPRLLERAGTNERGSITALYTVLTNESGDIDPLADEVKSLIDGHIILSGELYALGIMPAIDVTSSISRMFNRLHDDTYLQAARRVKRALTRLFKERELLLMGGTADDEMKRILTMEGELQGLLNQPLTERPRFDQVREAVLSLSERL